MRLALVILLLPAALRADTLADVRAALQTRVGQAPVRATYDVQIRNTGDEPYAAAGTVDVIVDTNGLSITFPRPMLEKLATQPPRGEGKNNGVRAADVRPQNVAQLLNYAPALLRQLEKAKVIRQTATTLVVNVPQAINVPKMVSANATVTLTLFLGSDHLPVSSEENATFSAGILFLKMNGTSKESMTFAHRDDRLIVAKRTADSQQTGFGQTEHQTETETLDVRR